MHRVKRKKFKHFEAIICELNALVGLKISFHERI